jgi:hypothetical protein
LELKMNMKMKKVEGEIRFYCIGSPGPEVAGFIAKVGVGPDGVLWIPPWVLRVTPAILRELEDFPQPVLMFDQQDLGVYVNAQAVAETRGRPEDRKKMSADIDALLDQLHPSNFR